MIDIDVKKVARIRLQSSANGTTWLTRLGTVGLLTATCTIAVSASKVFVTMPSMRMRMRIRMINVMTRWIPGESNQNGGEPRKNHISMRFLLLLANNHDNGVFCLLVNTCHEFQHFPLNKGDPSVRDFPRSNPLRRGGF